MPLSFLLVVSSPFPAAWMDVLFGGSAPRSARATEARSGWTDWPSSIAQGVQAIINNATHTMLRKVANVARKAAVQDSIVLSLSVSGAYQMSAIDAKLNSMVQDEQPIEAARPMEYDMRKTPLLPSHMMFSHVRNDLILSAVSHGLAEDGKPLVPRGPHSASGGVCSCCVQMPCVCKECS